MVCVGVSMEEGRGDLLLLISLGASLSEPASVSFVHLSSPQSTTQSRIHYYC